MEIKILCPCGTKFKFDVEPVNARMPAPVTCPACGADATDLANTYLRETLTPSQPTPAPAPSPLTSAPMRVSLPGQSQPAAAPAPAPAVPSGLRITRHAAPAAEAPADAAETEPPPPRAFPISPRPVAAPAKPTNPLVKALITIATLALIGFGLYRFGYKWYKRLDLVAKVATAVGEAGVDQGESEGARNLWYDNAAVLFVKHTNHLEIAEACRAFWKDKFHKQLTVLNTAQDAENPGEYELISTHNGWVRILGSHEWPVPQHEALVQYLSQKYSTLAFEWRSESFADTYHFGVYDAGTKKFHAQMDIKMTQDDAKEIVTTEGNDFAKANGYKPGKEGFKEFNVLDADKITQRLGMKLWDEKDGTELKGMLLKETGPAP